MISKILVPTDGSESAKKAVRYAADLAKQTGSTIRLISVVDKSLYASQLVSAVAAPTHLIEPIEDYLWQAAEACLDDAERLCKRSGVPSKKVVRTGYPVDAIVREAERSKADLIVIGSHGKSTIKATILGSVTFGIIHKDMKVPVLVVRR